MALDEINIFVLWFEKKLRNNINQVDEDTIKFLIFVTKNITFFLSQV